MSAVLMVEPLGTAWAEEVLSIGDETQAVELAGTGDSGNQATESDIAASALAGVDGQEADIAVSDVVGTTEGNLDGEALVTAEVESDDEAIATSEDVEAALVTCGDEELATSASADYSAYLSFSDTAITETTAGAGYSISGTTLTISSAGTYRLGGSCSEGAVIVNASNVVLELDGLTLTSSSTAPIVVKKSCTGVHIHLEDNTTSTITNSEDPANETSTDATVADAFEGACIKAKTSSSVIFCGGGNLTCVANTKNGIKGGTGATLTFNTTGAVTVSGNYSGSATTAGAVNNGIASDGALVFNAGTYDVDAANDGIKAVPDSDDTTSAGDITINGGTFDIDVDGDGIQAEHDLEINAGTFDIKTMSGYATTSFDEDTMSCKGIKASGDRTDVENTIDIAGGTFTIDTIDDAVHSDMYVLVTGGTFEIYTGDDGMHADTTLTLGTSGGLARDPDVNIAYSYEGLEAGTVYVYSGRHYVYATDDGMNAAGGSNSGSDQSQPGGDGFNGGGGGPGSGGGGRPQSVSTQATSSDYNLYIYGGELYVNCLGDGLDSNGGLYIYGGKTAVFSQASGGDNSPCDSDSSWVIKGGTLFCAGTNSMNETPSNSQSYYTSTSSRSANTKLTVSYSSSAKYSCTLPRAINYLLYSDPDMTSTSCSVSTGSLTSCSSCAWRSSWEHNWDSGSTADSITTYTCSDCSSTEKQTNATAATVSTCDHTVDADATTVTAYTATFSVVDGDGAASSNATINTYYTQDYTTASETNVTNAIARDSTTGEADVSGSGQINFTVVPADGYNVDDVSVEGSYKNLKGPSDTGVANTYRITKVAGDLTVTVTVSACAHANVGEPTWTWSSNYTTATAAFVCSDCGNTVTVDGTVTSALTDASTITFTATAELGGNTYTTTTTAAPFTGTFAIVDTDGATSTNATINTYYKQDYTTASETGVTTAVARDGDTGEPVRESGQINFAVVPADGYTVKSVTATDGTYKNIKGPATTEAANTYRLTKVSADTTITVTLAECDHTNLSTTPTWTWSKDYATATAAFVCSDCGSTVYYTASGSSITSTFDASTNKMTYTAKLTVGSTEYSDTQTVSVYPVQFDATNTTIDVYYTQDYTSADETGVTMAIARDGDSGAILTDGTGQVNFKVTPSEGYEIKSVVADANYKNLKDPTETGAENVYRLTKVKGTVNVTVAAEKITHTVTFDANGHGTTPIAQTVEYGEVATKPDDLSETGYVFGGWYKEAACTNVYDFSTAVTADLTLYAKWTEATYTVSYDANGGSGSIDSATVKHGATVTLSTDDLTAPDGKTFLCWCTSDDTTSGTCYAKNATVTITADTTFYAIWATTSTTSHSVSTADVTGGTVTVDPTSQTVGGDVTVTATPSTGYQLTAITYTLGTASVTAWTGTATAATTATFSMPAENMTVTATFEKIDYEIALSVVNESDTVLDDATLSATPSPANYGDTVTLTLGLGDGDSKGYTLKEWSVVSGDVTIASADGSYTFTMPASNVEIKAVCKQIEYTATFSVSNATINTYYAQDYTSASETNVTSAIARNSSTGAIDGTGSGQINFTVVPTDGYAVTNVAVDGGYNKLKDISSDVSVDNTYRITKVTSDLTVTITVLKEVVAPTGESLTYTTYQQTGVASGEGYTLSGDYQATNAGSYTATATLADGYVWSDGTTDAKSISWSIAKVNVTAPSAATGLVYDGTIKTGVEAGNYYTLSGTCQAANAGTYTATATLDDTTNYQWSDGTTADKSISWSISRASVTAPTAKSGLVYTGSAQTGVASGSNYSLSGTCKATNAGTYTAKAALASSNYQWSDGTTAAKSVKWTIARASIAKAKVTLKTTSYIYNGKAKKPAVKTVKLGGTQLVSGTDYAIAYKSNKEVGTAKVVVTGKGNYKGSATTEFAIKLGKTKLSTEIHPAKKKASVSWSKVAGAKSYQLQWRVRKGSWKTVDSTKTTHTLGGIKTGKLYEFRVRAVSGSDVGAWSNVSRRWNRTVKKIKVATAGSNAIKVTWAKDKRATGGFVVFVRYSKNGSVVKKATVKAGKLSATISGLKAGKTAWVAVRAIRRIGAKKYIGALTKVASGVALS